MIGRWNCGHFPKSFSYNLNKFQKKFKPGFCDHSVAPNAYYDHSITPNGIYLLSSNFTILYHTPLRIIHKRKFKRIKKKKINVWNMIHNSLQDCPLFSYQKFVFLYCLISI
eukprot:166390_1